MCYNHCSFLHNPCLPLSPKAPKYLDRLMRSKLIYEDNRFLAWTKSSESSTGTKASTPFEYTRSFANRKRSKSLEHPIGVKHWSYFYITSMRVDPINRARFIDITISDSLERSTNNPNAPLANPMPQTPLGFLWSACALLTSFQNSICLYYLRSLLRSISWPHLLAHLR